MHGKKFQTIWVLLLGTAGWAQSFASNPVFAFTGDPTVATASLDLPSGPVALPRMAPELALQQYSTRAAQQNARLESSEDQTLITAELPDTRQRGEYELVRTYTANPRALAYKSLKYSGDGFVKTTVIAKLLQSEVEHVQHGDTAPITAENYKFSYKGVENVDGHETHVFQIKPRKKLPGLMKGRIYIDAYSASLRRMEGTVAKSPSFFVKSIEFRQDFDDVDGFTVPTQLWSSAKARIIGKTFVSIVHRAYRLHAHAAPVDSPSVAGSAASSTPTLEQ